MRSHGARAEEVVAEGAKRETVQKGGKTRLSGRYVSMNFGGQQSQEQVVWCETPKGCSESQQGCTSKWVVEGPWLPRRQRAPAPAGMNDTYPLSG